MLPSAAELEYFLEVASTLNLSRAGERLGISQPSLSLAIKRLEHVMGTSLFIRHKHGVSLTQPGKQLLLHAKQLLQYWESTKSKALASQQEAQGRFIVGCNSVIAIYMVSKLLPQLLEKHPKLEIHFKHAISRKITESIINLSVDIGIVINPIKHPDLIIRKLGNDTTGFWVGPGKHQIQDIHNKKAVVICNPETTQTQSLLMQCKKMDITFDRMIATESLEVAASLTASGAGIGILPACVAENLYPDKLKHLSKMPTYSDEQCLIYRSENRDIQGVQTIIGAICAKNKLS